MATNGWQTIYTTTTSGGTATIATGSTIGWPSGTVKLSGTGTPLISWDLGPRSAALEIVDHIDTFLDEHGYRPRVAAVGSRLFYRLSGERRWSEEQEADASIDGVEIRHIRALPDGLVVCG